MNDNRKYFHAANALFDAYPANLIGKVFIERAKQDEQWGGGAVDITRLPHQWHGYLSKQLNLMGAAASAFTRANNVEEESRNLEEVFSRLVKITALGLAAMSAMDFNYPGIGGHFCDCEACKLRREIEQLMGGQDMQAIEIPADSALGSALRDLLSGRRRG